MPEDANDREKSVDQEQSTEGMQLNENQGTDTNLDQNPESHFEEGMPKSDDAGSLNSDDTGQTTDELPPWDKVEIEDDEEEVVDVVDAPSSEGTSLESEASRAIEEALKQEITSLKSQLEQYVRIAADFENFRKRTQKEREDMEQAVKCSTITELLPVVDNFERARSQIKPQTDAEMNIHKSYQSVYKQLVDCLKRVGVSPMRAEGAPFDPALHEAVMREPTADHPEGTVLEELVRGYMLGDRVIRHAMVKVAAELEDHEDDSNQATEGGEGS